MLSSERNGYVLAVPETFEDLKAVVEEYRALPAGAYVGADTETTGLDYYSDRVVGFCFGYRSSDGKGFHGHYLPVRHVSGNMPLDYVLRFVNWLLHRFQTVWFNRSFDFSMMEKEEHIDLSGVVSHDAQIVCWEATTEKFPSLKKFYRKYCKKEIDSFASTMSKSRGRQEVDEEALDESDENSHNFGLTDPRVTYPYGALDPVATLELFMTMLRLFPNCRQVYPLDNVVGEIVRVMTKTEFYLDYDIIRAEQQRMAVLVSKFQREVFDIAGYQFNINSSREKAEALGRFVTLTKRTAKGGFNVSIPILNDIDHPLARALVKYSEARVYQRNYIEKLLAMEGKPVRFNYKLTEVPTGRIASGGSRGNDYYAPINVQSIPSPKEILYLHEHPVLGIIGNDVKEGALGEYETKSGIRKAFVSPPGYVFMTFDYSNEEMRITANLSNERSWISAIQGGEDLHSATALAMFGQVNGKLRSQAKCVVGSTRVLCGKGYVPISELSALRGDDVWEDLRMGVVTTDGVRKTSRFYSGGKEDTYVITLRNGMVLESTSAHKYMVYREGERGGRGGFEWVRSGVLKEGDRIRLGLCHEDLVKTYAVLRKSVATGGVLRVTEDIAWYVGACMGRDFSVDSSDFSSFSVDFGEIERKLSCLLRVDVLLKDFGVGSKVSRVRYSVPEVMFRGPRFVAAAYVAGLWLQGGYFDSANRFQVQTYYITEHHSFALSVQQLLVYLGVGSSVLRTYQNVYTGDDGSCREKAFWGVHVYSDHLEQFNSMVKFRSQHCVDAMSTCMRVCKGYRSVLADTSPVESIRKSSAVVYDLEVPGCHNFYGGGVVNHNTINFGILYGMSHFALSKRLKISVQEAKDMLVRYHQRLPNLDRWMKAMIGRGRKVMGTSTYYGRFRPLGQYYNSSDPSKVAFADRSVVNGCVQGCVPVGVSFEMKGRAVRIGSDSTFKDAYVLPTGQECVLTYRGFSEVFFLSSASGEFLLCDTNHKLLRRGRKGVLESVSALECVGGSKVCLAPLQKRPFRAFWRFLFNKVRGRVPSGVSLAHVASFVSRHDDVDVVRDSGLGMRLWSAWFGRERVRMSLQRAANLRSVCSVYGFDLVLVKGPVPVDGRYSLSSEVECRVAIRRPGRVRMSVCIPLGKTSVAGASVRFGTPVYPCQGFLNRNTAADVLRIKLCEINHYWQTHEDFRKNVIVCWSVHDEIEFYVREEYRVEAFRIIPQLMRQTHENWQVPLEVDGGIGYSWGTCLDAVLGDDGRIVSIPKAVWYEGKKPGFIVD